MKARFERKICLKRNENKKKIDTDSWFSRENLKRLWIGLNLYTNRYAWGWHMRLNDIFLSASIEINLTQPWLGHVLSSVLSIALVIMEVERHCFFVVTEFKLNSNPSTWTPFQRVWH